MSIVKFQGENRWLSNFWLCDVELEGLKFKSVEAAYVAAKTTDIEMRLKIQNLQNPGECKRFGRKIKLRNDWNAVKVEIMTDLVRQKFKNNSGLREKLIKTGSQMIVEGNTWGDTFWGVCNGVGENTLGKIIMKVREELNSA